MMEPPARQNYEYVARKVYDCDQPRGGATIIEVNGFLITFGGVDREQKHYNDAIVYDSRTQAWSRPDQKGDIPTPRSGHAVAAYGKYMFLYGGINFAEEVAYNDLYILDTDTFEWKYVGETGLELKSRNSHTLGIIHSNQECDPRSGEASRRNILVIFGGASPEEGPMGDTVYAELPSIEEIETDNFYVTWQLLGVNDNEIENENHENKKKCSSNSSACPCAREMHSMCYHDGMLLVIGGRDGEGNILSDVWMLQCIEVDNHLEEMLFSPHTLTENHSTELNKTENENANGNKNENEIGKMSNKTHPVKNEEIDLKSPCIIQELDLSNSTSQFLSIKPKSQENIKFNFVNISPNVNRKYKLIWHEMTMLKLLAGRCAHTSSLIHKEIFIIGGVEEDSGLTDSVIKIPYPVSFPVSMKSSMKNKSMKEFDSIEMNSQEDEEVYKGCWVDMSTQINKTIHTKIPCTTIGARFGHCVCVLSHQMSSGMLDNTKPQQQQQQQHTTNTIHIPITNDDEESNSILIFGGVCAEKDFSDFVLLKI